MKKLFLLFLFFSSMAFSQMPNIEKVWLNDSKPYTGSIDKNDLKLKMNVSDQNKKNDQEYFVAGYTLVNGSNYARFEGKLKIDKYKDRKKGGTVYGSYELAEEPKGPHSGLFTGKFVYNFKWNRKSQQIEAEFIQFTGNWKSYDGTMNFRTSWSNNQKNK